MIKAKDRFAQEADQDRFALQKEVQTLQHTLESQKNDFQRILDE